MYWQGPPDLRRWEPPVQGKLRKSTVVVAVPSRRVELVADRTPGVGGVVHVDVVPGRVVVDVVDQRRVDIVHAASDAGDGVGDRGAEERDDDGSGDAGVTEVDVRGGHRGKPVPMQAEADGVARRLQGDDGPAGGGRLRLRDFHAAGHLADEY